VPALQTSSRLDQVPSAFPAPGTSTLQPETNNEQDAHRRKVQPAEARFGEFVAEEDEAAARHREEQEVADRQRREAESRFAQLLDEEEKSQQRRRLDISSDPTLGDSPFASMKRLAHEGDAVKDRYRALRSIAKALKVIGVVSIVLMWIGWFAFVAIDAQMNKGTPSVQSAVMFFEVAIASIITWAISFAFAEIILLAIDASNDLRISRVLLRERFINDTTIATKSTATG